MRIAYAYAPHHRKHNTGGAIHIKQFIANAIAIGHEIWTWPGDNHLYTRRLPSNRLKRLIALRHIDVIYYRVDFDPPGSAYLGMPPFRRLIGNPHIVWELNGVPEFGRVIGQPDAKVQQAIQGLRHYGLGCDLAICVSESMTNYVKDNLGLSNVITVPNGSDPALFQPDTEPVLRVKRGKNLLNVVWIGSGELSWVNFKLLQQTASLLYDHDNAKKITFHIIGQSAPGLMREMPPNVQYHGVEVYEMLPHWLAAMDIGLIFYQPGISEYNSPLKLFDYMASGLIVVSTPQPQVQKIFAEMNQLDLITPYNDSAALSNILIKLAQNPDRIKQQGQKGRNLVVDKYNWHNSVQHIMQAIETLSLKEL